MKSDKAAWPYRSMFGKTGQGQPTVITKQVSATVPKSAILRFCPSRETCWGVPSPNSALRLAPYGISRSEFLRQAIRRSIIRPVIHVSAVNDERPTVSQFQIWHRMGLELEKSGSYIRGVTSGAVLPSLIELFNIIAYFNTTPVEFFAPWEDDDSIYHKFCK